MKETPSSSPVPLPSVLRLSRQRTAKWTRCNAASGIGGTKEERGMTTDPCTGVRCAGRERKWAKDGDGTGPSSAQIRAPSLYRRMT